MTPPPESHEKRQRDRRKKLKRKEKLERRLQRKDQKRRAGGNPIYHTLHREGDQLQVLTDLWLGVLNLAAVSGWTPPAIEPSDEPEAPKASFSRPAGLKLDDEQAQGLAKVIRMLLPMISEEELPLSRLPFGEEQTERLLARRAAGEELDVEDAFAAHELLSGPPKKEVELLAAFLEQGAVEIEPTE